MKKLTPTERVFRVDDYRYILNGDNEGNAATLKTSNHRDRNITFPEGGRGEMGILEYEKGGSGQVFPNKGGQNL